MQAHTAKVDKKKKQGEFFIGRMCAILLPDTMAMLFSGYNVYPVNQ